VIATFCHNIANGLPVHIDDPSKSIHLVYIDDLVQNIIDILGNIPSGLEYRKVTPEYSYTLGQIAEKIHSFRDSEKTLITDRVGTGFVRRLYATYLSYIPIDKVSYSLPVYADERGDFVEVLKTKDSGQFSYFTVLPGVTRGGHYHHTKNEKFVVLNGTARFKFRNISTGETKQIICSSGRPKVVNTFPGWAHDITNIGDSKMLVMIWANEIFDRDFPDTISWTL